MSHIINHGDSPPIANIQQTDVQQFTAFVPLAYSTSTNNKYKWMHTLELLYITLLLLAELCMDKQLFPTHPFKAVF